MDRHLVELRFGVNSELCSRPSYDTFFGFGFTAAIIACSIALANWGQGAVVSERVGFDLREREKKV